MPVVPYSSATANRLTMGRNEGKCHTPVTHKVPVISQNLGSEGASDCLVISRCKIVIFGH